MSKTASSIDAIRAQFASATLVYWVCPITNKKIPIGDVESIEAHQTKVIEDMESKERSKLRQKMLRDINDEAKRLGSLEELRGWVLRRMQLDDSNFGAVDMPQFSMFVPHYDNEKTVNFGEAYVRVNGGKKLSVQVKVALGIKQGKTLLVSQVGKGVQESWFMKVPSSALSKKMLVWINRKAKKLSETENAALQLSNPEHAKDIAELKALGVQIHALREQAAALSKKCQDTRNNALTALPQDLT